MQAANWPALVAAHERAIELYRARLNDIEELGPAPKVPSGHRSHSRRR